jgi:hypothetical protein
MAPSSTANLKWNISSLLLKVANTCEHKRKEIKISNLLFYRHVLGAYHTRRRLLNPIFDSRIRIYLKISDVSITVASIFCVIT